VHSAEIEYALGNLPTNKVFAWTPDDYQVSKTMQGYFANFIKTGNPNGAGLPTWPKASQQGGQLLRLDVQTKAVPDQTQARYQYLEKMAAK
jgi:para-nitrobenzyl esterase